MNTALRTYGYITDNLTFVSLEFPKERSKRVGLRKYSDI